MIKKNKILVLFFVISSVSYSQKLTLKDYVIEEGDTILLSDIPVIEILTFNDAKEKVRYNRLKRKVLKVYPYAIYTKNKLKVIEEELSEIKRRRKKKQHTKQVSSFLKEELGEKMKKLTRSEGNILVKLIYRETNISTYKLLKEYRGSLNAFFWQTTAKMYDNNLKQEYDPVNNREDMLIEHIIINAKLEGKL
ncbi:MAG: hypothetical protein CMP60_02730 [Flavobacteriales bacterium]|nr:hypothetical protein [Flavobacteriales bacterium]|tara:strand:+ start:192 stop:770 length:579 start_codon:yes stop_codon:yes gene_type:complete